MRTLQPDPNEVMPANERLVHQGGLMRCCIATVHETTDLTKVGTVLDCKYEPAGNRQLIVDQGGTWVWNRP